MKNPVTFAWIVAIVLAAIASWLVTHDHETIAIVIFVPLVTIGILLIGKWLIEHRYKKENNR